MAGVQVALAHLRGQMRVLDATTVERLGAPWPEAATLRPVDQRRRLPGDRGQPARLRPVEPRNRAKQPPGVGVLRVVEDLLLAAFLDDAPGVHDENPVA